jgi:hypothetical protein
MILFDDVVEVSDLTDLDSRLVFCIVAFDRRRVGTALVDRDLFRRSVPLDCFSATSAARTMSATVTASNPRSWNKPAAVSTRSSLVLAFFLARSDGSLAINLCLRARSSMAYRHYKNRANIQFAADAAHLALVPRFTVV